MLVYPASLMRIPSVSCGVAFVLLASRPAMSEELVYETPALPWYERVGIGLSLGGGVDDFVSDALREVTSLGGSWNIRATIGTRARVAGEVSYIGAAQSIDAPFLDGDAVLVGNGLQAAVRVDVLTTHGLRSFVYGGAAWRHYDLLDVALTSRTARDADDDDVFEVPVGIGIAGHAGGLIAELRAEYRPAWGSDLVPALARGDDALFGDADRWGVTGNLGLEF